MSNKRDKITKNGMQVIKSPKNQSQLKESSSSKKSSKKSSKNSSSNSSKSQELAISSSNLTTDDIFKLTDLYFSRNFIIYSHNFNSYDKFIDVYIKNFLIYGDNTFFERITNTQVIKYKLVYENIRLAPPTNEATNTIMYPSMARDKNETYASKLSAFVSHIQEIRDATTHELISTKVISSDDIVIAVIPIMVKSKYCSLNLYHSEKEQKKECDYDPGCYFIINGAEKVIIPQEQTVQNKAYVFPPKNSQKDTLEVKVNSVDPNKNGMQIMRIIYKPSGAIVIKVPIFDEFPVSVLFRLMGLESDEEIINAICYDKDNTEMINMITRSIVLSIDGDNKKIDTRDKAMEYIINKIRVAGKKYSDDKDIRYKQKKLHVETLLSNCFMPHIPGTCKEKILYVGYMINKLLNCILGVIQYDDRDSLLNKRIKLSGDLLFELFVKFYKKLINDCRTKYSQRNTNDENPQSIINDIRANLIGKGINSALATGTFDKTKGVAQPLPRMTYMQEAIALRRIDSPSKENSQVKLFKPRMYHVTQTGMLCPIETPERGNIGFTKQLTMVGNVTIGVESQINIIKKLINNDITRLIEINTKQLYDHTRVHINGEWVGLVKNAIELYIKLKNAKYSGLIEYTTSISFDDISNDLYIWCDSGRLFRPVLRVENNELLLTKKIINSITKKTTWDEFMLVNPGVIEFIDCDEQIFSMIAPMVNDVYNAKDIMNKSQELAKDNHIDLTNRYNDLTYNTYSHCEIHPSLLIGTIATTVPFCNRSTGTRSTLHYAHGKQAMCTYASNYRFRLDNAFMLYHPQKPIIDTRTSKYVYFDILSPGENIVIAVMCYTGFNQEDSVILNQNAIDRGIFRSTSYEKHMAKISKNQSTSIDDEFTKPDKSVVGKTNGNYDKLNDRGFIPEETEITNNDVLIGKITSVQSTDRNARTYRDSSTLYKHYIDGVVDKVYNDIVDQDSYEIKKIRTRSERIPIIGDKLTGKYGQKGTIGLILPASDMPYTEHGLIPDIIFNPSSIHGRNTMSFMLECLYGKAGALQGIEYDATAFIDINTDNIKDKLKELGYNEYGIEYFYNGMTGEKIKSMIFTGAMYYLRLKHMVSDKIHARSTGPRSTLVRQPSEGRSRGGGLKIGEMERDVLIAHGMAQYAKEKLIDVSDTYDTYVCNVCGMFAQRMNDKNNKITPSVNDVYQCPNCADSVETSKITIPYAFKLLVQELQSCNINPRLHIRDEEF